MMRIYLEIKFTQAGSIAVFVKGEPISMEGTPTYDINIYVRDTGIGIEQSDIQRIFKRFEQIDTSLN